MLCVKLIKGNVSSLKDSIVFSKKSIDLRPAKILIVLRFVELKLHNFSNNDNNLKLKDILPL